jgi:16S rRNA (uracil1498-N3)-methyltransferase
MTLPQHLIDSLAHARVGEQVSVDGEEAHHAVVVRRLQGGERVRLADGCGRVAVGEVSGTGKRSFVVTVTEVIDEPEPSPRITVVQALAKGDRGERAVEVLTEVGAATIIPWAAERSVAVWKGERAVKGHRKWVVTAREAAKQARRSWVPVVAPLATTDQVVEVLAGAPVAAVLHEDATVPLTGVAVADVSEIVVVVGPEGGLTEGEVAALAAAGAVPVRMGAEVLRTSTAGLAAVAALLSRTSRWR